MPARAGPGVRCASSVPKFGNLFWGPRSQDSVVSSPAVSRWQRLRTRLSRCSALIIFDRFQRMGASSQVLELSYTMSTFVKTTSKNIFGSPSHPFIIHRCRCAHDEPRLRADSSAFWVRTPERKAEISMLAACDRVALGIVLHSGSFPLSPLACDT